MPKKHQRNLKIYESHGPSQTPKPAKAAAAAPMRTVNERLTQLRKEGSSTSSVLQKANEMTTVATQRTIPPELRNILNVPETAPPQPRPGIRPRGFCRTAGPAPPPSWLETSIHTPWHVRKRNLKQYNEEQKKSGYRQPPDGFSRLAKLKDTIPQLPPERSLLHQTLKTMALNWEFVSEYEVNNLATIRVALKSLLMIYLSVYSSDQGIDIGSLKVLFLRDPELPGGTGAVDLSFLDLTGLISFGLGLSDLQRYLSKPIEAPGDLAKPLAELRLENEPTSNVVLDSWEDEASSSDYVPKSMSTSRFPDLRRISLAHAGTFASWKDLLALTHDLPRLTHLSLAYWPVPTMTPNSRASFIETKHAKINVSGTHLYSNIHSDWHEAANILRRLSNNTYCLQWLDLEGCAEWTAALTFHADESRNTSRGPWVDRTFGLPRSTDTFQKQDRKENIGVAWNGSWSQVTYVNLSQGCLAVGQRTSNDENRDILHRLNLFITNLDPDEEQCSALLSAWNENKDRIGGVDRWCENYQVARTVQSHVREMRQNAKGTYCHFDHGWIPPDHIGAGGSRNPPYV